MHVALHTWLPIYNVGNCSPEVHVEFTVPMQCVASCGACMYVSVGTPSQINSTPKLSTSYRQNLPKGTDPPAGTAGR